MKLKQSDYNILSRARIRPFVPKGSAAEKAVCAMVQGGMMAFCQVRKRNGCRIMFLGAYALAGRYGAPRARTACTERVNPSRSANPQRK